MDPGSGRTASRTALDAFVYRRKRHAVRAHAFHSLSSARAARWSTRNHPQSRLLSLGARGLRNGTVKNIPKTAELPGQPASCHWHNYHAHQWHHVMFHS